VVPSPNPPLYSSEESKPKALLYDEEGALFVADVKRKCVLSRPQPRGDQEPLVQSLVSEYEGKQLQGPTAMCFDENGTLYFTDSCEVGVFGADKGSVFTVSSEDQMLRPLALKCLNYPTGIACDPTGQLVYVAETSANRVLRFARRLNGVYYSSVYHTFTGGFGPTGIVERQGMLFVARADLEGAMPQSKGGSVCVIGTDGNLLRCRFNPLPGVQEAGMRLAFLRRTRVLNRKTAFSSAPISPPAPRGVDPETLPD